jgi:hypothetical protein
MRLKERATYGALRWLARLQYDWRDASKAIAAGVHSEIPTCCIAFFVFEWAPWAWAYGQKTQHPHAFAMQLQGLHSVEHAKSGKSPQYVPCPDCLTGKRFTKIHKCTPECADKVGGSFVRQEDVNTENEDAFAVRAG